MIVFVASYEHKHGTETRVYRTREAAAEWGNTIARENWSEWFPNEPMPDENVGEVYFDLMLDKAIDWEFFRIDPCVVEPD